MPTASRTTQQESSFGLVQVILLVTFLLVGALVAFALHSVHAGSASLAITISKLLPAKQYPWLPSAVWGLEVATYFALAFTLANRQPLVTIGGVVLGIITRIIVTVLSAMLLMGPMRHPFSDTLQRVDGDWVYRLVALLVTGAILAVPFRRLLETGFGFLAPEPAPKSAKTPSGKAPERPKQFAFASKTPAATGGTSTTATSQYKVRASAAAAARARQLQPPDNFTPVVPMDNVYGMVNISARVILQCVPEAEAFIHPDSQVRIRLAYIVPQLQRGTVWLNWLQIFPSGVGGGESDRGDSELKDRWVRIQPKYYVMQVPREYFTTTKAHPAWMKLSEVVQENQFQLDE